MRAITASLLVRNTHCGNHRSGICQRAGSDSIGSLYTARRHIGAGVSDLPILPQPDAGAAGRAEATDTSLYYCTLDKYRDVYTYDAAAGVPVLTTPAGEGYPELLVWLDEYTVDYTVTDSEGNALPVGEKRLGAPTIVQVRDGVPTSAWKLTSVADADYPDDKYTRWNAETQDKVYNSLYHYFVQEG